MANAVYPKYLTDLLNGAYDTATATIGVALLNNSSTFNSANTDFSSLVANQIGSTVNLAGQSVTSATLSGDSTTFTGIAASLTVKAVVLFHNTGGGTGGALIAWFDTGTGFPLTTDGTDITVNWNATPTHGDILAL